MQKPITNPNSATRKTASTNTGTSVAAAVPASSASTLASETRPISHYLLWADTFQFRLPQAQTYLERFRATNGWSADDAAKAQRVTIVGPAHLLTDVEQQLIAEGIIVERIAADDSAAIFADLLADDLRLGP